MIAAPNNSHNFISLHLKGESGSTITYIINFFNSVEADFLNHQRVDLVCGGLDTISTIIINDVVIANTSNMFRRYVFNVGKVLKVC